MFIHGIMTVSAAPVTGFPGPPGRRRHRRRTRHRPGARTAARRAGHAGRRVATSAPSSTADGRDHYGRRRRRGRDPRRRRRRRGRPQRHLHVRRRRAARRPCAVEAFGRIDIVVNNAGVAAGWRSWRDRSDHRGAARARVRGELHRNHRHHPRRVAASPRAGLGSHREHRVRGRARRPHPRRGRHRVRRGQGRGVVGDVVARAARASARHHGQRGVAGRVHPHERGHVPAHTAAARARPRSGTRRARGRVARERRRGGRHRDGSCTSPAASTASTRRDVTATPTSCIASTRRSQSMSR